MKHKIIMLAAVFTLLCGVLIFQGTRSSPAIPAPAAGATYQELMSFIQAKKHAALGGRQPLFWDVVSIVYTNKMVLLKRLGLRRGHPFLFHSHEYLFRYGDPVESLRRDGPGGFGVYGGTNISRWEWKWDL
jgi:hypothetical protein